jgi:hypothetical protein
MVAVDRVHFKQPGKRSLDPVLFATIDAGGSFAFKTVQLLMAEDPIRSIKPHPLLQL